MIALLDTNKLDEAEQEIGVPCEQLLTPLTQYRRVREGGGFAIDNGAFSRFDARAFLSLLAREWDAHKRCRFVVVPDVVGSARRTLEVFEHWRQRSELRHWPLALALQDGQEDQPIPWIWIKAVFVAGSTRWKESKAAEQCIKAAQAMGKWVHVGRVNTPARWDWCEQLGVDSVDGSGIARYSHMRVAIRDSKQQQRLFAVTDQEGDAA